MLTKEVCAVAVEPDITEASVPVADADPATPQNPGIMGDSVDAAEPAPSPDTSKDTADLPFLIDRGIQICTPGVEKHHNELLRQSLQRDGCRNPLIVAIVAGEKYLIKGYKRLDLCLALKIPYAIHEIELPSRDAAILWRIKNELEHSRLSDDQRAIMAVTRYWIESRAAMKERAAKGGRAKAAGSASDAAQDPKPDQPRDEESDTSTRGCIAREARISTHKLRQALDIYDITRLRIAVRNGQMRLKDAHAKWREEQGMTKTAKVTTNTRPKIANKTDAEAEPISTPFACAANYLTWRQSNQINADRLRDPATRDQAKQILIELRAKVEELDQLITAASNEATTPQGPYQPPQVA